MKKFLIFTAVMMMFLGASFYHNGLSVGFGNAKLTVYEDDKVIETCVGTLNGYGGVQRLDLNGSFDAEELLRAYDAVEMAREYFDDVVVIYAFSPMLTETVKLDGRNVNLMIALRAESAVIGTPIIKGSY